MPATLAAAILMLAGHRGSALAVTCGDTITTTQTLPPGGLSCSVSPALTIDGGTLDMAGTLVSASGCSGGCVGILLTGNGSKLMNGVVSADGLDVQVQGSSGTVSHVTTTGGTQGFFVGGTGNTLKWTNAYASTGDGYRLVGSHNHVTNSHAVSNGGGGFVVSGSSSKVDTSSAETNGASNVVTTSTSAHTTIKDVDTYGASGTPGVVIDGFGVRAYAVTSNDNGASPGFLILGHNNVVGSSRSLNNSVGYEVAPGAYKNKLKQNQAFFASGAGFLVDAGATSNLVQLNVSSGSGTFDLEDDNPGCDGNGWFGDVYATDTPSCAQ